MKRSTIIFTFFQMTFGAFCQGENIEWKIDTIQTDSEKSLVYYEVFKDSSLIESANAYLYPISFKAPTFCPIGICILGKIFQRDVLADSLVYDEERKTYLDNKFYKTEIYDLGNLQSTMYYNSENQPIRKEEFFDNRNTIETWGTTNSTYLVKGEKKKKK